VCEGVGRIYSHRFSHRFVFSRSGRRREYEKAFAVLRQ
jgi:hypothetical protein